jgi:predicted flap endonuclease-1-like 5' DNA nuclease
MNGVGPNAAKMLYEAGYHSPADVAAADAGTMLARVAAVNADGRYYAGKLGEKDMQFCIDSARLLEAFG